MATTPTKQVYVHTASLGKRDRLISAQLRSAHLAAPTMHYAFSRTNINLKRQNQTVQLSV